MTSYDGIDSSYSLPSSSKLLSASAPTFALLSEKGESLDIDLDTGLPKLPVELPESFVHYTMEESRLAYRPEASHSTARKQVCTCVYVCLEVHSQCSKLLSFVLLCQSCVLSLECIE